MAELKKTTVKVKLNDAQLKMLDDFRDTFGMSRSYALRFIMIGDLSKWEAAIRGNAARMKQ